MLQAEFGYGGRGIVLYRCPVALDSDASTLENNNMVGNREELRCVESPSQLGARAKFA